MISEIILGTFVPLFLVFNSSFAQSLYNGMKAFTHAYTTILQTTCESYEDRPLMQLASPIIALFECSKQAATLCLGMISYAGQYNITQYKDYMAVDYVLHGKSYSILLPTKSKTDEITLLEAYGLFNEIDAEESKTYESSEESSDIDSDYTTSDPDEKEDIMEYLGSILGPDRDFHNQSITPTLLGYDEVIIRYVDGQLDEKEVLFKKEEVICLK